MSQEHYNSSEESQLDFILIEPRSKKKKGLLTILLIVLTTIGIIVYINLDTADLIDTKQGGVSLQIDAEAREYVPAETEGDRQGVAIPGWGTLNIPANTTEITVDFFNPEANKGKYYLTFELRLPANNEQGYEVLYTSGLIKPGLHVQNATLSRELEEGNYEAIIHVQPYYMNELDTPTNNAELKTKLVVK